MMLVQNLTDPDARPRVAARFDEIRVPQGESDYRPWLMFPDLGPPYPPEARAHLPLLDSAQDHQLIPLPPVRAQPVAEESRSALELRAFVPVTVDERGGLTALPNGWLYIFIDGHLWREIRVTSSVYHARAKEEVSAAYAFSDVDLLRWQGRDDRAATGANQHGPLLVPTALDGQPLRVSVAFSPLPWTWAYLRRMGGMNPRDPRYIAAQHGEDALPPPGDNIPTELRPDPRKRLQDLQLAEYGAAAMELPAPLPPDSTEAPSAERFAPVGYLVPAQAALERYPHSLTPAASVAATRPKLPFAVIADPVGLALRLAAQHQAAWAGLNFQRGIISGADDRAEAGRSQGVGDPDTWRRQQDQRKHRFESARMLYNLFFMQPKELSQQPGANAARDARRLADWSQALREGELLRTLGYETLREYQNDIRIARERLLSHLQNNSGLNFATALADVLADSSAQGICERYRLINRIHAQLLEPLFDIDNWLLAGGTGEVEQNADLNEEGLEYMKRFLGCHASEPQLPIGTGFLLDQGEEEAPAGLDALVLTELPPGLPGLTPQALFSAATASKFGRDVNLAVAAFIAHANRVAADRTSAAAADLRDLRNAAEELEQLKPELAEAQRRVRLTERQLRQARVEATAHTTTLARISAHLTDLETAWNQAGQQSGTAAALVVATQRRRLVLLSDLIELQRLLQDNAVVASETADAVVVAHQRLETLTAKVEAAIGELQRVEASVNEAHTRTLADIDSAEAEVRRTDQALANARSAEADAAAELAEAERRAARVRGGHEGRLTRRWLSKARRQHTRVHAKRIRREAAHARAQETVALHRRGAQRLAQSARRHGLELGTTRPDVELARAAAAAPRRAAPSASSRLFPLAVLGARQPLVRVQASRTEVLRGQVRPGAHAVLHDFSAARVRLEGDISDMELRHQMQTALGTVLADEGSEAVLGEARESFKREVWATFALDEDFARGLEQAQDLETFLARHRADTAELREIGAYAESFLELLRARRKAAAASDRLLRAQDAVAFLHEIHTEALARHSAISARLHAELEDYTLNLLLADQAFSDWIAAGSAARRLAGDAEQAHNALLVSAAALARARQQADSLAAHLGLAQQEADDLGGQLRHLAQRVALTEKKLGKGFSFRGMGPGAQAVLSAVVVFELGNIFSGAQSAWIDGRFDSAAFADFAGASLDLMAAGAQVAEWTRYGAVGKPTGAMEALANRLLRDALAGHASRASHGLSPALRSCLLKTAAIAFGANVLGGIAAAVTALLNIRDLFKALGRGDKLAAVAFGVLALGSALQAGAATATATMMITGASAGAGAALIGLLGLLGFVLVLGGALLLLKMDPVKDLLAKTTWGTEPYDGKAAWRLEAAQEQLELLEFLFFTPRISLSPESKAPRSTKTVELFLPHFEGQACLEVQWRHETLPMRYKGNGPQPIFERERNYAGQLTLTPSDLAAGGLTRRWHDAVYGTRIQSPSNAVVCVTSTGTADVRLRIEVDCARLHEVIHTERYQFELALRYYPQGRHTTLGLAQLPVAVPVVPYAPDDPPQDEARPWLKRTLIAWYLPSGAADAESWRTWWSRRLRYGLEGDERYQRARLLGDAATMSERRRAIEEQLGMGTEQPEHSEP